MSKLLTGNVYLHSSPCDLLDLFQILLQLHSQSSRSLFYVRNVHQSFDQTSRLLLCLSLSPSDLAKGQSSAGELNQTDLRIVSLRFSENEWNRDSIPLRRSSQLWFPPICWEMLLSKCDKREQRWPFCVSEGRSSFSIHLCRPRLLFIELRLKEAIYSVALIIQSRPPYCSMQFLWVPAVCLLLNYDFSLRSICIAYRSEGWCDPQ